MFYPTENGWSSKAMNTIIFWGIISFLLSPQTEATGGVIMLGDFPFCFCCFAGEVEKSHGTWHGTSS